MLVAQQVAQRMPAIMLARRVAPGGQDTTPAPKALQLKRIMPLLLKASSLAERDRLAIMLVRKVTPLASDMVQVLKVALRARAAITEQPYEMDP